MGAFVAVLGLTTTATGQIGHSFSVLQDTTITVNDIGADSQDTSNTTPTMDFPPDADARLQALNGVVAGGVWWTVPLRNPLITTSPAGPSTGDPSAGIMVFAASPGTLRAMSPTVGTGTLYNAFHQNRAERVCLLGSTAAHLLGITRVDDQPAVFVDNVAYTVVGIISNASNLPQTLWVSSFRHPQP